FLFLILLLLASRECEAAEARTCESQSHGFKGRCLSDHNCGLVCRNEGFTNGLCRGFRQRCFCTKIC
ncbi:kunitz trypsin inhibitor protein, partial [Genlisea aurea]